MVNAGGLSRPQERDKNLVMIQSYVMVSPSQLHRLRLLISHIGSLKESSAAMRIVLSATALLLFPASSHAFELTATSRVEAVTVFLSGAEVTRTGKVKLEKGEHTITITDVPASAVPGSIRVEGKATGKLDIGSVDTRRTYLARAESQAADAERKKLEDEIEALRDQKTGIEAQVHAAETQKALIGNLAQLPVRPAPPAGQAGAAEDWQRVLSIISQGTADASRAQIEAQAKIRDLDHRIEELENKLSLLAPAKTDQTEVKVHVEAASPLEADLTIRYQVANAGLRCSLADGNQDGAVETRPRAARIDYAKVWGKLGWRCHAVINRAAVSWRRGTGLVPADGRF